MDPPEVLISALTSSHLLSSNVEGCRNALIRMCSAAGKGLKFVPSPSTWTCVGRVLHTARRQCRVGSVLSIDDAINDGRTLEYVFVCYVNSAAFGPMNGASRSMNGDSSLKDSPLPMKWMARSELTALFLNKRADEVHLDHKFKAVASKCLALSENISSSGHNYWVESQSPPPFLSLELIFKVEDLLSDSPQFLQGDDR